MSSAESFLTSLKGWFSSESAEAKEVKEDVEARLDTDLTRRENELKASSEQRLDNIQDEIDGSDSAFDNIRAKIETSTVSSEVEAADVESIEDPPNDSAV